jgi:hypothetical protein
LPCRDVPNPNGINVQCGDQIAVRAGSEVIQEFLTGVNGLQHFPCPGIPDGEGILLIRAVRDAVALVRAGDQPGPVVVEDKDIDRKAEGGALCNEPDLTCFHIPDLQVGSIHVGIETPLRTEFALCTIDRKIIGSQGNLLH